MYESALQLIDYYHTTLWAIDITVLTIAVAQLAVGLAPKTKSLFNHGATMQVARSANGPSRFRRRDIDLREKITDQPSEAAAPSAFQPNRAEPGLRP